MNRVYYDNESWFHSAVQIHDFQVFTSYNYIDTIESWY